MTIVDKILPELDPEKMKKGVKTADQYYRGFIKMSGYSWAIAIVFGGAAYAGWKLFGPKTPDQHQKATQHPQPQVCA